jgi:hypothetical protein
MSSAGPCGVDICSWVEDRLKILPFTSVPGSAISDYIRHCCTSTLTDNMASLRQALLTCIVVELARLSRCFEQHFRAMSLPEGCVDLASLLNFR